VSVPTDLVLSGPHPLRGRLRVPGDKGMSHRALLFAAMAGGASERLAPSIVSRLESTNIRLPEKEK